MGSMCGRSLAEWAPGNHQEQYPQYASGPETKHLGEGSQVMPVTGVIVATHLRPGERNRYGDWIFFTVEMTLLRNSGLRNVRKSRFMKWHGVSRRSERGRTQHRQTPNAFSLRGKCLTAKMLSRGHASILLVLLVRAVSQSDSRPVLHSRPSASNKCNQSGERFISTRTFLLGKHDLAFVGAPGCVP